MSSRIHRFNKTFETTTMSYNAGSPSEKWSVSHDCGLHSDEWSSRSDEWSSRSDEWSSVSFTRKEKDARKAFAWGLVYYHGNNEHEANLMASFLHFKDAMNYGHPIASRYVGLMYCEGIEGKLEPDFTEAARAFWKAGTADPPAMRSLAKLHQHGLLGVKKDLAAACRFFAKAATHGDVESARWLGLHHYNELDDKRRAAQWFAIAASHEEDPVSLRHLAQIEFFGERGGASNVEAAAVYYQRAADAGDHLSLTCLGSMHLLGSGVEQSNTKAATLLTLAAEKPRQVSKKKIPLSESTNSNSGTTESIGSATDLDTLSNELAAMKVEVAVSQEKEKILTDGFGFTMWMKLKREREKAQSEELAQECEICFAESGEHDRDCMYWCA